MDRGMLHGTGLRPGIEQDLVIPTTYYKTLRKNKNDMNSTGAFTKIASPASAGLIYAHGDSSLRPLDLNSNNSGSRMARNTRNHPRRRQGSRSTTPFRRNTQAHPDTTARPRSLPNKRGNHHVPGHARRRLDDLRLLPVLRRVARTFGQFEAILKTRKDPLSLELDHQGNDFEHPSNNHPTVELTISLDSTEEWGSVCAAFLARS